MSSPSCPNFPVCDDSPQRQIPKFTGVAEFPILVLVEEFQGLGDGLCLGSGRGWNKIDDRMQPSLLSRTEIAQKSPGSFDILRFQIFVIGRGQSDSKG